MKIEDFKKKLAELKKKKRLSYGVSLTRKN